jgi:tRNA (guanine-N7-)-methyltransferase
LNLNIEALKPMDELTREDRYHSIIHERKKSLTQLLTTIFPHPRNFVCEFGSGHGHFLVAYAQAHPNAPCIGVDIESDRVARAQRKQERAKATHLHFVQADARLFLEVLPAGAMFDAVYILFPDPWPKKRHHKHRLIQPSFLDVLRRHSTANTRLYFRTDFEPYFAEALAVFEQHAAWQVTDEPWPFEHETVFQRRAKSYRSLVARIRPAAP